MTGRTARLKRFRVASTHLSPRQGSGITPTTVSERPAGPVPKAMAEAVTSWLRGKAVLLRRRRLGHTQRGAVEAEQARGTGEPDSRRQRPGQTGTAGRAPQVERRAA